MGKQLSENERIVAFSAQFHARASVAELSKTTGLRSHTVRYALDRLLERGVLKPYTFIDCESLGYAAYNLFCSLSSHRSDARERFEQELVEHDHVSAVYRIGGDFHYRVVLLAKTSGALLEILDELIGPFGEIVFERSFVIRCGAWLFARRYLHAKGKASAPLYVNPSADVRALDAIDVQILHALGEADAPQLSQIAANLKLPTSTFEYRLRRLQKEGIVKGWVYSLDVALIGMLDYRLLVTMTQVDRTTREAFYAFCSKHPQIYTLTRCIGSWDYEVGIEVEAQEQVTEIVQNIYEAFNGTVRSVKTIPVFDCLKTSMFPFQPEHVSTT